MSYWKAFFGLFLGTLPYFGVSQSPVMGIPFIRNFSTQEYRAGIQNWQITQDARGVVYIANNFGLLEYDGNNWEVYPTTGGSKMRSLAIDPSGKVYVGCQREFGYFFPDFNGRLTYTSLADSLPSSFRNFDETWKLFLDGSRQYYCTFTNIYIYEKDSITIIEPENPLELSFLVNRELWVDQRGAGLSKLNGNKLSILPGGDFFKDKRVSSILPGYDQKVLISTYNDGIFEYSPLQIKPWSIAHHKRFKDAIINVMIRLKNGNYAIGTQNEGLLIVNNNGELMRQFTTGKGLGNRTVLSVMEDDAQNLWVGLNNGLTYIELGSPFTFINESIGLPGTGYAAYLDNNDLYLGTNTGLYKKDLSQRDSPFKLMEGTQGQVYHVGKYGDDILLGHHNGSYRIENDRAVLLSAAPGSWIFVPLSNQPDLLIGGLYGGLQLFSKRNNHWEYERKISAYSESSRVMEQDVEGNLWITHGYKGVFKLKNYLTDSTHVSFYGQESGFPSNMLINVYKIRNELIFTSERGVYQFDAGKNYFERNPFFTKLMDENVQLWKVQEDAMQRIYFIGRDQIGRLQKTAIGEYDYIPKANLFSTIRSYLNDDLETIIVLSNNEVLFGAKEGFVHYDPNFNITKGVPFKTLIRRFSVTASGDSVIYYGNQAKPFAMNGAISSNRNIRLPYALNSVAFSFAAPAFEISDQLMHQFKLENFDRVWSEWTTTTRKEYTNLKEGSYTFHVRSRNSMGDISGEATYTFIILPPWYRTAWAFSGYALTIIIALFLSFALIDRKYKYERRVLTIQQKKELIRKENEIEQLELRNQQEITRLMNEKLESELQHKNKELATSTIHLLNKNEFISHLKDHLQSVARKNGKTETTQELVQMIGEIESNLSSDSDWENFQQHFDNVHGDFSRRFRSAFPNLSPQEMKLCAYLRMNLSTKEIANLLSISIRGVEISRYRLRKKLKLDRNTNLQEFILNF
ncbi:MAG: two component regulator three y domain-containing protein [Cyclobacteriaceae bacterium]|nr:two component regulator three y domain-containing protein [Cyclobacteriaceae bacterium]